MQNRWRIAGSQGVGISDSRNCIVGVGEAYQNRRGISLKPRTVAGDRSQQMWTGKSIGYRPGGKKCVGQRRSVTSDEQAVHIEFHASNVGIVGHGGGADFYAADSI